MRAYILVECDAGKPKNVVDAFIRLRDKPNPAHPAKVINADSVMGVFDVILMVEASDLDAGGRFVTDVVQATDGVTKTTTCLVAHL